MRLALIPPMGLENWALKSSMQMALCIPTQAKNLDRTRCLQLAQRLGSYVIMDNGANEGDIATAQQIREYFQLVKADELVLPDALDSGPRTVREVEKFIAGCPTTVGMFKSHMAVVQGSNPTILMRCVEAYASIDEVDVIGIPRRIIDATGETSIRINLCNQIMKQYPGRFQVHLLGAHPAWPQEIKWAAKYTSARSMDTSLPFNFAIAEKKITDLAGEAGVPRPDNYFIKDHRHINQALLDYNVETALGWVDGA